MTAQRPGPPPLAFDERDALARMSGDRELLVEVARLMLDDIPGRLDELGRLVAAGDLEQAAGVAHSVKGSASNLSSPLVLQRALDLELAARQGRVADVGPLLRQLHRAWESLRTTLEELCRT